MPKGKLNSRVYVFQWIEEDKEKALKEIFHFCREKFPSEMKGSIRRGRNRDSRSGKNQVKIYTNFLSGA